MRAESMLENRVFKEVNSIKWQALRRKNRLLGMLEQTMIQFGVPGYICSDDGPKFIAAKVPKWLYRKFSHSFRYECL